MVLHTGYEKDAREQQDVGGYVQERSLAGKRLLDSGNVDTDSDDVTIRKHVGFLLLGTCRCGHQLGNNERNVVQLFLE